MIRTSAPDHSCHKEADLAGVAQEVLGDLEDGVTKVGIKEEAGTRVVVGINPKEAGDKVDGTKEDGINSKEDGDNNPTNSSNGDSNRALPTLQ